MATITKNINTDTLLTSTKPQLLFAENTTFYDWKCSTHGHRVFVSNILIKRKERWEPLFNIHKEWFGPTAWHVYLVGKDTTYLGKNISNGGVPTLLKAVDLAWNTYQNLQLEDGEYMVADKSFSVMSSNKFFVDMLREGKEDFCVETSFAEIPDESQIPQGLMDNQGTYLYDSHAKFPICGNESVSDNKALYKNIMNYINEGEYSRALNLAKYNKCGASIEKRKLFERGERLLFVKGLRKPDFSSFGCTAEKADEIIAEAIQTLKKLYINASSSNKNEHPTYAVYDVWGD